MILTVSLPLSGDSILALVGYSVWRTDLSLVPVRCFAVPSGWVVTTTLATSSRCPQAAPREPDALAAVNFSGSVRRRASQPPPSK